MEVHLGAVRERASGPAGQLWKNVRERYLEQLIGFSHSRANPTEFNAAILLYWIVVGPAWTTTMRI